jgi:hypothetical protein
MKIPINVFWIFFVYAAFYFIFLTRLFNLVRRDYPDKYKEFGEPSLWRGRDIMNSYNILRCIFSNDPLFLADIELKRTQKLAQILFFIGLVISIIFLWSMFNR